jgi:predicted RNA binding protein YcfA (HicA-like mRNA interferase family)
LSAEDRHSALEKRGWRGHIAGVPRKIRELVADLEAAGFMRVHGGKGSHRKFRHPKFRGFVLLSGADGADAQHYQERQLRNALRQVQS